jgi:hypothetical protein
MRTRNGCIYKAIREPKPAEEAILRVVLPAVLAAAFALSSPVHCNADDPDVARLVALVNHCKQETDLQHISVHINKLGKAKHIIVKTKAGRQNRQQVEAMIKHATFAGRTQERKIQLTFNTNPKANPGRRFQ